ncbi:long-chain fatty acid--CoA ligase [Rhizorhabdus dicambivorans]|uniref:3-methylmercaptopropionyl-CoA ligase n=1 Tax=Rhizorhabdus dicambivorans TaxID=1850238 RepID=A0A2A4FTT7_9SPHN|nr:long-chain fatty acid--CoA ligase [Rhizorhabdus dicambivorans]PCE41102.1 long-chain fatty acid--CoA ligase [Rhizorhabdus dicambivorans]
MLGGMQDWPLRVSTIIDHAATAYGRQEVVTRTVEGPIHRTDYATIAGRARRVSAALQRMGVGIGDRIATLAWNTYRHIELWYGIAGAGAVYHTVNPRLSEDQIAWIVNDAEDRMIFTDLCFVPLLEKLHDRVGGDRPVVVLTDRANMPDSPLDLLCYEELIAAEEPGFAWIEVPETAPVGLCYTSGTTGAPKGVLYTHRSNVLHSLTTSAADVLGFRSRSVIMPVVPMFHANAWAIAFSAPMAGAKLVMPGQRLDGPSLCDLIEQEGVTCTAGVPTVWIGLIDEMRRRAFRSETLERIIVGGSACPEWMMESLEREFGLDVVHAWGMTEMSPVGSFGLHKPGMAALDAAARRKLQLKQGAAFYGVEMRILDPEGRELPWDGVSAGRLQVRGCSVVREYFKGAGGDILDAEGWFDTGDLATIDDYGYMQVTDRTKDVIKSGGEWISSVDLENQASGHEEVVEAAAIGIPDDKWGERPLVAAIRTPGSDLCAERLRDWLRPRIARWWLPEQIIFVDSLPHTATGKLDKVTLRRMHAEGRLGTPARS